MKFYTQNGFAGDNYSVELSTKDIASVIRKFVKNEFPGCKFSVTSSSTKICVNMVSAKEYPFTEEGITRSNFTYGNAASLLTDEYYKKFYALKDFIDSYRFSDSDSMMDYYDTNFYYEISIGNYSKEFSVK